MHSESRSVRFRPETLSLYASRMARILRIAAVVMAVVWVAWNLYRHVVVYFIRGRVVVMTDRVVGNLVGGAGLLIAVVAPTSATIIMALVALATAATVRWKRLWVVVGASPGRIFERAGLVLRGMNFPFEIVGERSVEERRGRIRISVVASPAARTHVLRLRLARGIRKVALFGVNLRKFLVTIPRERR